MNMTKFFGSRALYTTLNTQGIGKVKTFRFNLGGKNVALTIQELWLFLYTVQWPKQLTSSCMDKCDLFHNYFLTNQADKRSGSDV